MILTALVAAAAVQTAPAPACLNNRPTPARGAPVRPVKLAEMPPADLHLPVNRIENGCSVPVIRTRNIEAVLRGRAPARPAIRPGGQHNR